MFFICFLHALNFYSYKENKESNRSIFTMLGLSDWIYYEVVLCSRFSYSGHTSPGNSKQFVDNNESNESPGTTHKYISVVSK